MTRDGDDIEERKYKNKAQCMKCEDIIESKHRHDFVRCKCGTIFLDGGNDYWRAGADDFKNLKRILEPLDPNGLERTLKNVDRE